MKWVAISGSWRKINEEIEENVRKSVREIVSIDDGIISGGALGVDSIALDEALKIDLEAERIKIFLPTTFETYSAHYRKHAMLGTITSEQAENLVIQLTGLQKINPKALIENLGINFNEETKKEIYYQRNSDIIDASDALVAFRVKSEKSEGLGTADAVKKAQAKGIPVQLFQYDLTNL